MRYTIAIGPTPWNEACVQLGEPNYEFLARQECSVYMRQLMRHYEAAKKAHIPKECVLFVKANKHDFGTYLEVHVQFEENKELACEAAYWFENNQPEFWDDQARADLGLVPALTG